VTLTVGDVDLQQGMATIQHLKTRLKLGCPCCGTRLGRSHASRPKCGIHSE
jgi:integrase/recombinase XerD